MNEIELEYCYRICYDLKLCESFDEFIDRYNENDPEIVETCRKFLKGDPQLLQEIRNLVK